jgi:hypothetical protein
VKNLCKVGTAVLGYGTWSGKGGTLEKLRSQNAEIRMQNAGCRSQNAEVKNAEFRMDKA